MEPVHESIVWTCHADRQQLLEVAENRGLLGGVMGCFAVLVDAL